MGRQLGARLCRDLQATVEILGASRFYSKRGGQWNSWSREVNGILRDNTVCCCARQCTETTFVQGRDMIVWSRC